MNKFELKFSAMIENEAVLRVLVSAFLAPLGINDEEIMEVKTIVSEGVSNAIIHGLNNDPNKMVEVKIELEDEELSILIKDEGKGIEDLELALTPMYSTLKIEEHTGMGFTIMSTFSDEFDVKSAVNHGTEIHIRKYLHHYDNDIV